MSSSTTSKKIQRVQRAGASRRPGTRRPAGFTAAIVAILVLGVGLVAVARNARVDAVNAAPRANEDTWRDAFAVYNCGEWFTQFTTSEDPTSTQSNGITSSGDGTITIAPTNASVAGQNARLGLFLEAADITAEKGKLTLPGDEVYEDGDDCEVAGTDETAKGKVVLYRWPPQANENVEPDVITSDFSDVRFSRDGEIFALAFVQEDMTAEDMPLPPSVAMLATDATTTTAAEGATTTTTAAEGDTTTTTAAEGDTTTTAGG